MLDLLSPFFNHRLNSFTLPQEWSVADSKALLTEATSFYKRELDLFKDPALHKLMLAIASTINVDTPMILKRFLPLDDDSLVTLSYTALDEMCLHNFGVPPSVLLDDEEIALPPNRLYIVFNLNVISLIHHSLLQAALFHAEFAHTEDGLAWTTDELIDSFLLLAKTNLHVALEQAEVDQIFVNEQVERIVTRHMV